MTLTRRTFSKTCIAAVENAQPFFGIFDALCDMSKLDATCQLCFLNPREVREEVDMGMQQQYSNHNAVTCEQA